jgi:hypothetical protein
VMQKKDEHVTELLGNMHENSKRAKCYKPMGSSAPEKISRFNKYYLHLWTLSILSIIYGLRKKALIISQPHSFSDKCCETLSNHTALTRRGSRSLTSIRGSPCKTVNTM